MSFNLFNFHTNVCKNTIEIFLYQCFTQHYPQQLSYENSWCIQQQECVKKICSIPTMVLFSASKNEANIIWSRVNAVGHNHIEQTLSIFFLYLVWIHKSWVSMWHERRRQTVARKDTNGRWEKGEKGLWEHVLNIFHMLVWKCPGVI